MTQLKLNIGAGDHEIVGFLSVDRKYGIEAYPLPYEDNSADEIYASHILEHFPLTQIYDVMGDWVRVLKPGCWIYVAVPNVQALDFNDPLWVNHVMGGQTYADNFHYSCYNESVLVGVLETAGLTDLQYWRELNPRSCASHPVSLNMCGRKP